MIVLLNLLRKKKHIIVLKRSIVPAIDEVIIQAYLITLKNLHQIISYSEFNLQDRFLQTIFQSWLVSVHCGLSLRVITARPLLGVITAHPDQ